MNANYTEKSSCQNAAVPLATSRDVTCYPSLSCCRNVTNVRAASGLNSLVRPTGSSPGTPWDPSDVVARRYLDKARRRALMSCMHRVNQLYTQWHLNWFLRIIIGAPNVSALFLWMTLKCLTNCTTEKTNSKNSFTIVSIAIEKSHAGTLRHFTAKFLIKKRFFFGRNVTVLVTVFTFSMRKSSKSH